MIISRAPYRISLFGGGSDYPEWFIDNGGKVLSMAIDKYCYISVSYPYHDIPFKVVWRHVELCEEARDILHPAVRGALEMIPISGVEIHYHGELPARSGMGSSSSFAVALLNALHAYKDDGYSQLKNFIFEESIRLERDILGEVVGWQDQAAATYGGFHIYEFGPGEKMRVLDLHLGDIVSDLVENLFLVYTHLQRRSSFIAEDIVSNIKKKDIGKLVDMVDQAYYALILSRPDDVGHLLHESWEIKKSLSPLISSVSSGLDYVYDEGRRGGALGGKALGCGGGGFMVFYVPFESHEKFLATMKPISTIVPFSISYSGMDILT